MIHSLQASRVALKVHIFTYMCTLFLMGFVYFFTAFSTVLCALTYYVAGLHVHRAASAGGMIHLDSDVGAFGLRR